MATLYVVPPLDFSQGAQCLIAEAKLEIAIKGFDFFGNDTSSPEFLAKNPFGTCPTLEEGNFVLWESHTILRYLCNKYNLSQWYSQSDPLVRATIDDALDWKHRVLHPTIRQSIFGRSDDQKQQGLEELKIHLSELESVFLKDGQFINGFSEPTIADLSIRPALNYLVLFEFSIPKKVQDYIARFDARVPSYAKVSASQKDFVATIKSRWGQAAPQGPPAKAPEQEQAKGTQDKGQAKASEQGQAQAQAKGGAQDKGQAKGGAQDKGQAKGGAQDKGQAKGAADKGKERKQSEKGGEAAKERTKSEKGGEVAKERTKSEKGQKVEGEVAKQGEKGGEAKEKGGKKAEGAAKDTKNEKGGKKEGTSGTAQDAKTEKGTGAAATTAAPKNEKGGKKAEEPKKDEQGKKDGKKGKESERKPSEKADSAKQTETSGAAEGKLDDKRAKACIKEGGKKGQDMAGMSTFGSHYFCAAMEEPKGELAYLELCMEAANKEVDPEAEDRKGGAGDIGKLFLSSNDTNVAMICHVPKERTELTLKDWFGHVMASVGAQPVGEQTEFIMRAQVAADPDNGKFTIKMKDVAIGAAFQFLREKGLVLDDSDDDTNYAEAAGINLNAAPGSDY